jgi:hypothetical protein
MDFYQDLNSWSKHYREEALREIQERHLAEQASGTRRPLFSGLGNVGSMFSGVLGALKG